jgi:hypothetical protein
MVKVDTRLNRLNLIILQVIIIYAVGCLILIHSSALKF